MLSVKLITTYHDFLELKNSWDLLFLKSGIQSPYLTHDWFRIAYEHFEAKNQLFIMLVSDQAEVVAIVPCLKSKEKFLGLSINKILFLNNVHTPYQDFIAAERKSQAIAAILDFLHTNTRLWDVFELQEIREDSDSLTFMEELAQERNIFRQRFLISTSWTVPTDISPEKAFAKISGQIKRKFRKYLRRLENFGNVSFRVITDYREIEEHFRIFFKFYEQSWKGKEKNSDFYYTVAHTFCQNHGAILFTLCLDQRPIAYVFSLKSGRILFGKKATFDSAYYAFSPGIVLISKIIEYCLLAEDIDAYNFGRGNEQYKQIFAGVMVNQVNLLGAHKRTVVSYLFFLRYKIVLLLKNNKYSCAILNSIRDTFMLGREISMRIGEKYSKYRKYRKPIFYSRPLQPVNAGVEDSGFQGKYAGLDDLNQLAVATKAKRFSDLIERLENEKCFLITRENKIEHYFWLSKTYDEHEPPMAKDKSWYVTEHDDAFRQLDKKLAPEICNLLCAGLISSGGENLIIAVQPDDSEERDLVETLGFKK